MSSQTNKPQKSNRREFLRSLGRIVGGGALLAAAGFALARRGRQRRDQVCIGRGLCRGCGRYERCGLPAALSARQAKRQSS